MATFDRFDIAEAHCVLEWDYNVGGWLPERPTNQRRMQSTGVQLSRMKFKVHPSLSFDTLTENAREIYFLRALEWNLPLEDEQLQYIRKEFSKDWLEQHYPLVAARAFAQ